MIKLGTTDISSIKLGSINIEKIYLGANLIYPSTPVFDPDVINFIGVNGITDTIYINALNTLVLYLKANGIYSKIQAWWIFYGNATQSKYNFINPSLHTLTFFGGGTIDNNGFLGNGINAYAGTDFFPDLVQNVNSNGLGLVCGTNNATTTSDVIEIGCFDNPSKLSALVLKESNVTQRYSTTLNAIGSAAGVSGVNESRGIWFGCKNSSSTNELFRNGLSVATGSGGGTLPTNEITIMALNLGSAYGFSTQRIQEAMAVEGLNSTEIAIISSGLDTFENSLGRKTW